MADLLERRRASARRALKEVFGFDDFRPFQGKVIDALLAGKDTLAVAPTGGGKSVVFQIPAMVLPGVTVVISPLLALMKDQVDKLKSMGVSAVRLTTDENPRTVAAAMADLSQFDLIYTSPEKAKTSEFRKALQGVQVGLWACDEAHCISTWGFRASYAHLGDLFDSHDEAVRLACTATADVQVEEDIHRVLRLRDPVRVVGSPWRPNISWQFEPDADESDLLKVVDAYKDNGSTIVYTASRKECERLCDVIQSSGMDCAYYHAGMEQSVRQRTQQQFMDRTVRRMVATSAFGMGVDVSDIRLVASWQMPASLFDLLQMIGRASRDGEPALGWVRLGPKASKSQDFFIRNAHPDFRVYDKLWSYLSRKSEPQKWSRDVLMRIAGVGEHFSGQLDAALAYLEFSGHINTAPGGTVYRLPIKNRGLASRLCASVGARIDGGVVVYEVAPGAVDRADAFTNAACDWSAPAQMTVIWPTARSLTIDEEKIEERRCRAYDQLSLIEQFAESGNLEGFVAKVFAK